MTSPQRPIRKHILGREYQKGQIGQPHALELSSWLPLRLLVIFKIGLFLRTLCGCLGDQANLVMTSPGHGELKTSRV